MICPVHPACIFNGLMYPYTCQAHMPHGEFADLSTF